jgi:hypothetical protein
VFSAEGSSLEKESIMSVLDVFNRLRPYFSELVGTYQPLFGLKSRQTKNLVGREQRRLAGEVLSGMLTDPRYEAATGKASWELQAFCVKNSKNVLKLIGKDKNGPCEYTSKRPYEGVRSGKRIFRWVTS